MIAARVVIPAEPELAWAAGDIGLRHRRQRGFATEDDRTEVTVEADARGPLAFSDRYALPQDEQALLFVAMLNGPTATVR